MFEIIITIMFWIIIFTLLVWTIGSYFLFKNLPKGCERPVFCIAIGRKGFGITFRNIDDKKGQFIVYGISARKKQDLPEDKKSEESLETPVINT